MIPFTDDDGLRNYRVRLAQPHAPRRRRWPWLVLLAFVAGVLLGAQLHAAAPCVQLQVRPQVLLSRGDVDVQARVARHADHRSLTVTWDSDVGAGGRRTFDLEGTDRDDVLFQWINQAQPAGHYVFDARVGDAGGRALAVARAEIRSPEIAR